MRVLDTTLIHTTDNNSTILVNHDVVEAHATALNQTGMFLSNQVARGLITVRRFDFEGLCQS